ncbi:MAG: hypothetical protein ACOYNL_08450 [Rickettsiales bacterium]
MATAGFAKQNTFTMGTCCWSDGLTRSTIEGPALRAEDMSNIDTKLDDGLPRSGFAQIYAGYAACITGAPSIYNSTNTTITCQPLIGMGI